MTSQSAVPAERLALAGYGAAVLFGGLHALSSLYWGLGGTRLLATVGRQAVELGQEGSRLVLGALLAVAAAKALAVLVPLVNRHRRGKPLARTLRVASALGGAGLLLYGGVNTVVAWAALLGAFGETHDRAGLWGHAVLWSPMFALWGLGLLLGLWADRRRARRSGSEHNRAGTHQGEGGSPNE